MSDIKVAFPTIITNKDLSDGYVAQVTSDNALKVTGTINAVPGEVDSGLLCISDDYPSLGSTLSTVVTTYTVGASSVFYLKGITASASSGPCKVVVEYTNSLDVVLGTLCVGFFSSIMPTLQMSFPATINIPSSCKIRISMTNKSPFSQDVYATIMGRVI